MANEFFSMLRSGGVKFDHTRTAAQHKLLHLHVPDDEASSIHKGDLSLNFFDNPVQTESRSKPPPRTNSQANSESPHNLKEQNASTTSGSESEEDVGNEEESEVSKRAYHAEAINTFRRRMRIKVQGNEIPDPIQVCISNNTSFSNPFPDFFGDEYQRRTPIENFT